MPSLERLENLFRFLLPPACREHVLGDLHEQSESSRRKFLIDALAVLAPVVISRIRRTTDYEVLLIEAFSLYLSYTIAAWCLGQRAFLYARMGFARLAVPTLVVVAALLMCNAYADSEKRYWMKPFLQSAGSISLAFFGQAVVFDLRPSLAIPFHIMLYGSCAGVLLITTLRAMFPPVDARLKTASLNHLGLRKPSDLAYAKAPFQQLHRKISQLGSPPGLKIAFAISAAFLIAAAVFGSTAWHGVVFAIIVAFIIYGFRTGE